MTAQERFRMCPKCGHAFAEPQPATAQCPACGLYLFKWGQVPSRATVAPVATDHAGFSSLLAPLVEMDAATLYGRGLVLVLLAVWSWSLAAYDYRDGEFFDSFMHNILLPIHEAGHVFLIPFGEFMTILGGSLLQLALPLGIAVAFVLRNRDNFAAALGLWWTGVSLLDLSPYIYDALHPQLTLLGGHTGEDGPHDWIYLLGVLGRIDAAQRWGALAHGLGAGVAWLALCWAGVVWWRQRQAVRA